MVAAADQGSGRRAGGRAGLLVVARELLSGLALEDVCGFLGPRPVARAAGVSPGAVGHHFGEVSVARSLFAELFESDRSRVESSVDLLVAAQAALADGEHEAMRLAAAAAAADLRANIEDRELSVASFLAYAVAGSDAEVAALLRGFYGEMQDRFAGVYAAFARATGRRFDGDAGFSAETVAVLLTAVADGLIVRSTFDPDGVDPDLFAETAIRLFDATTVLARFPEASAAERILAEAQRRVPGASAADQELEDLVVAAAVSVYCESGWREVWEPQIARVARVTQQTVRGVTGTRNQLGARLWVALHLDGLREGVDLDPVGGDGTAGLVDRHVARLIEGVYADPELAATLVAGHLERLAAYRIPESAGRDGPFDQVVDVLAGVLRAGDVEWGTAVGVAEYVTSSAVHVALADRRTPPVLLAERVLAVAPVP